MRKVYLLLFMTASVASPLRSQSPEKPLAAAGLPEFLAGYQKGLDRVEEAYAALANESLPLRDETGQPLGRHPQDDRRAELAGLRELVRQLAAKPQDLVLTTRLFIQTETLVDDLYDLSQISYDNDREELGKRFADLEGVADHDRGLVESYALSLAAEKQKRFEELEKQNRELEQKLEEARQAKTKSRQH